MGKLKDRMPVIDAFIDELRAVFGREEIDRAIVAGLRDGTFHAQENGHEVGKPVNGAPGVMFPALALTGMEYVIHVKRRRKGNGDGAHQASED